MRYKKRKKQLGRFILKLLRYPITNESGTTDRMLNQFIIWLVLAYVTFSIVDLVLNIPFGLVSIAIMYIIYIQTIVNIYIRRNQFIHNNQKDMDKSDNYVTYYEKMDKIHQIIIKLLILIMMIGFLLLLAREAFWSWIFIGAPPLAITLCNEILESIKRMYTY